MEIPTTSSNIKYRKKVIVFYPYEEEKTLQVQAGYL